MLGWTFTETKTIYGNPYLVIHCEETIVGGMMLIDGNVPDDVIPCGDPYIAADDVEASAKRVEKLGGEVILPSPDIPRVGRFWVIFIRQLNRESDVSLIRVMSFRWNVMGTRILAATASHKPDIRVLRIYPPEQ